MPATNPAPPHARNLIGGQWVDSPKRGTAYSPATGAVLGSYADAELEHARAAVAAARRAFTDSTWSRDRQLRARALNELADRMTERRDDLVTLLARENGKTLGNAAMEVDSAIPKLRYNAALALTDAGHAGEVGPGTYSMTLRQPIGVAGVIVPWNSPVVLSVRSFSPRPHPERLSA